MKVSILGTGLMGFPMAEKLLEAGHSVFAYNRTREKALPLEAKGAQVMHSPDEAVGRAECVVVMVSDAKAVGDLLFSDAYRPDLAKKTVIQMSTIGPEESRGFNEKVLVAGGEYLECPVLGSIRQVRERSLILMFGGSSQQFDRWRPFLRCFGEKCVRAGEVGQAAALKLAMNQLIASHIAGFSQSLALVQKSGVDVDVFQRVLHDSALHAPMFDAKLPNLLGHSYDHPNFPLRHLIKDVRLFLETVDRFGIDTAPSKGIANVLEKALAQGKSGQDYSCVFETIQGREE